MYNLGGHKIKDPLDLGEGKYALLLFVLSIRDVEEWWGNLEERRLCLFREWLFIRVKCLS